MLEFFPAYVGILPAQVAFLQNFNKETAMQNVFSVCPKGAPVLQKIKGLIVGNAKKLLAHHCSSFVDFLSQFASGAKAEILLDENLVGAVSAEAGSHSEDTSSQSPFNSIFEVYFSHLKVQEQVMEVPQGDGLIPLTCSAVCAGAGLLSCAKNLAKLKVMLTQVTTKVSLAQIIARKNGIVQEQELESSKVLYLCNDVSKHVSKTFASLKGATTCVETVPCDSGPKCLEGCKEVLLSHVNQLVTQLLTECSESQDHVGGLIQSALVECELGEAFETKKFEPRIMKKACEDQRFKQLFNFAVFGKKAFRDARGLLKELTEFCAFDREFFQDPVTKATAVIKDLYKFVEESGAENKSGLAFCGRIVGSVTVAQSLFRELSTGETRQGLANNALQGLKRHGFECHPTLNTRAEDVIRGKLLSK